MPEKLHWVKRRDRALLMKSLDLQILLITIKENTGGFFVILINKHAVEMHIVVTWHGFFILDDLPPQVLWIQGKDCKKFNAFL